MKSLLDLEALLHDPQLGVMEFTEFYLEALIPAVRAWKTVQERLTAELSPKPDAITTQFTGTLAKEKALVTSFEMEPWSETRRESFRALQYRRGVFWHLRIYGLPVEKDWDAWIDRSVTQMKEVDPGRVAA